MSDVARARDIVALGQSIETLTVGRVDGSDMYRAALTQAVSALDHYVHGVVLDRATDIVLGRSTTTGSAGKVGMSFSAVGQVLSASTPADKELAARTQVSARLSLETYQRSDDIGAALAMVGIPKVWSSVFGGAAGSTTVALGLIVTRRNRIVHQSDSDPLTPGALTPLLSADALASIATVESIVVAIDSHC
ncbi:hypothetical protein [Cryobacterium sp. N22]|uniref:hypothetical protein n=1 Tax=Cryobacterium sp. N22 TaxID=2048290 RepID=UPI0011B0D186|nr:hypothetical protein [Cryobacterium sp. N22]